MSGGQIEARQESYILEVASAWASHTCTPIITINTSLSASVEIGRMTIATDAITDTDAIRILGTVHNPINTLQLTIA